MAKVFYLDPIEHLSGKIAKKHRTIYCHRNASGKNYTTAQGKRSTQAGADELEARNKFRICTAAARTRMEDSTVMAADQLAFRAQSKYSTMLGFLVARAYSKYDDSTHTVVWNS